MDWNRVEGQWKIWRGQVREQWGKLTDDDLDQIHGKKDQLLGRLQKRYGWARDDAERRVDDWTAKLKPDDKPDNERAGTDD